MVDVADEQGDPARIAGPEHQGRVDRAGKLAPVGRAGEPVMRGDVPQRVLDLVPATQLAHQDRQDQRR